MDALYEVWRPRLLRYCTQLLHHGHDAEEVVQDVFTKLVAGGDRRRLDGQPEVLLFRMARNRCIDVRRKHAPQARDDLAPSARDEEPGRDLREAIARLPFDQREALVLTAIDGVGYREAAAILGVSLGTVAARRGAAIQELQRRLAP